MVLTCIGLVGWQLNSKLMGVENFQTKLGLNWTLGSSSSYVVKLIKLEKLGRTVECAHDDSTLTYQEHVKFPLVGFSLLVIRLDSRLVLD